VIPGLIATAFAAALISGFVFYWVGKDQGEKAVTWYVEAYERVLKELNKQKFENRQLQRSMEYYDDGVLRSILEDMDGDYSDSE